MGSGAIAGLETQNEDLVERLSRALEYQTDDRINVFSDRGFYLFSTRDRFDQGRFKVAFNGHLLDEEEVPEKLISELFQKYGEDFPKHLEGSYRVAIYDSEKDRLHLVTDKKGERSLFYAKTGDKAFASHLPVLTAHPKIDPELDLHQTAHFLNQFSLAAYGGRTFFKKVRKMLPASFRTLDRDYRHTYWDLDYSSKIDISDEEAVEKIEELLRESASYNMEKAEGTPTVMLSGGSDSVFLASLMDDVAERDIRTITYGWAEEDIRGGREIAEEFGFKHDAVLLDKDLPRGDEIWRHSWPSTIHTYAPYYELKDKLGMENIFDGLSAEVPFPSGLGRIRRLDRFRRFKPLARLSDALGITRIVGKFSPKGGIALEVLSSPYSSAIVTGSFTVGRTEIEPLLSEELPNSIPEELLDERFNVQDVSFQEDHTYLMLKARDVPRRHSIISQSVPNFDVFTYTPLLEYTGSLPMHQKRKARLMKKIGEKRGWLPPRLLNASPSGGSYVINTFRRRMMDDREHYDNQIESFIERGLIKERGRKLLMPQSFDSMDVTRVVFSFSAYLLETYIQQFIDREEPWKPPT